MSTSLADPAAAGGPSRVGENGRSCDVFRLGLVSYEEAWQLQDRLAGEIARRERTAVLLLLEHPHTYTFGRRGKAENLLWDREELARRGITVHWVDRGGDVTYHGPGQLVGYPLLPLAEPGWANDRLPQADFVGYIRRLELMLIQVLDDFGIRAGQLPGLTGVWVPQEMHKGAGPPRAGKIASIGVKVDVKGISRHGFALNVAPDMAYWAGIVPCGLQDVPMVAMADLLDPVPSMEEVMNRTVMAFGHQFSLRMEEQPCEKINPV